MGTAEKGYARSTRSPRPGSGPPRRARQSSRIIAKGKLGNGLADPPTRPGHPRCRRPWRIDGLPSGARGARPAGFQVRVDQLRSRLDLEPWAPPPAARVTVKSGVTIESSEFLGGGRRLECTPGGLCHRGAIQANPVQGRDDPVLREGRAPPRPFAESRGLSALQQRAPQAPELHPPCPSARLLDRRGPEAPHLADQRPRPCAEARVWPAHLEDVRAKIADLRAMERVLRETVARCANGRRADCPLIERPIGRPHDRRSDSRRLEFATHDATGRLRHLDTSTPTSSSPGKPRVGPPLWGRIASACRGPRRIETQSKREPPTKPPDSRQPRGQCSNREGQGLSTPVLGTSAPGSRIQGEQSAVIASRPFH